MMISFALAQDVAAAAATPEPSLFMQLFPWILIFVVFYFLLIRPQQKKMKEHQQMVNAIKRGDKIVTAGGVIATVNKVDTEAGILHVDIAKDVTIQIRQGTVAEVVSRPEPANQDTKTKAVKEVKKKTSKK